ncbi:hypothetical protein LTR16_006148 [Cryomyces antarcticus]|uniref:Vacuolar ATPase assembly protein VMA22 n=1 Tax=Cryomyces antarcticus TaxID=329879 RepID=A0ABR0M505_9PEZI|nr:hypothetical protein LTR39_005682 [Cryomyces antarcticus]KAK5012379.1 hypothetical protein LTR60_004413 [Cryomyces antarcticus]KAK5159126.1 hypothetical protein LTR04_005112 [Oleoguttula sp. CCFEE 6159]KAK5281715.1 hypothetical protein LTR16_006148 [Cryomyces antarcticus]
MAATLQLPTPAASTEQLVLKLDSLWEKYLLLLDQYQSAQQQLAQHLSSLRQGHLSLARANFSSPSRIRYGQDYYDERMQASRRVTVGSTDDSIHKISIASRDGVSAVYPAGKSTGKYEEPRQEPTPPATPQTAPDPEPEVKLSKPSETDEHTKKNPESETRDPLNWYGILVPPALRAAQADFISTVERPVPELVNTAQQMSTVEVEIKRVRKELKKGEKAGKS